MTPNTSPAKNPTPRDEFRETADFITQHRNLVDSPAFTRGIHFALLEYQRISTGAIREIATHEAMAAGFKIQGAIEFVGVLKLLAESAPPMPKIASQQLDHRA